jgi:hypothetical protein
MVPTAHKIGIGDSKDGGWESHYYHEQGSGSILEENGETIHGRNSLSFTVKRKLSKK